MKLTDVKNTKVASYRELVEMFDALVDQINTLTEAVIPVDADLDIEQQLAELTKRMEAARRGLGLVNKFPAGPSRTEHRKRIMGNLNTIRAMLGRVLKQQEQFNKAEAGYQSGVGYGGEENEETWNDNRWERGGGSMEEEVCPDCDQPVEDCECDVDYGDPHDDYNDYEDSFDHNRFASKGSALYAADDNNPREFPCPTCERENALTLRDVQAGYQCDRCADRAERGFMEGYGKDPQGPRPKLDRNGKIIKPKRPYTKDELDDIGDREYQYRKENPKEK